MTFVGQNLRDWENTIESYVYDGRPLNLDEMSNLISVIRAVRINGYKMVERASALGCLPTNIIQEFRASIG